MHLHILGICGTFMAGIAALARESGHRVTGSDAQGWPPMSTQLETLGIKVLTGYSAAHLDPAPDVVVVGNVVTRGNPAMEFALNEGMPYVSGPEWLAAHVLRGRHVLAVAGTHGKTTTTSLLAWLLEDAGLRPGFLVGGVPANFGVSARIGKGRHFVIEADEYDTAFFDKRSKFVHYGPRTAILNNLEYDHADIFPDLAAIERQFHHLVRTVPSQGRLIVNGSDPNLPRVLAQGCWSEIERFDGSGEWTSTLKEGRVEVSYRGATVGLASMPMAGRHNRSNALAAIAAAAHAGVAPATALESLAGFRGVKRRLELRGEVRGIQVFDDFAHHPTAIEVTIAALREGMGDAPGGRILAVLEPRSNTMRLGGHAETLARSLSGADAVFIYARPDLRWDANSLPKDAGPPLHIFPELQPLIDAVVGWARPSDRVLVMSNGDFGGIHGRLLDALA